MAAADKPLTNRQPMGRTPVPPGLAPTTDNERGSGASNQAPEPRFLAVGEIVGAHSIRGEIKVEVLTDDADGFEVWRHVLIGPEDQEPVRWALEGYRRHKGRALLKLEGCDDRNCAEAMRGHLVWIPIEQARPLQDDEYYEHQIVDMEVWTGGGELLGQVIEVLYTGANQVYVIETEAGSELLIPAIDSVVRSIDVDAGRIVVDLMEGLV